MTNYRNGPQRATTEHSGPQQRQIMTNYHNRDWDHY